MPIPADNYLHISTNTTTQVYTGPCIFKAVIVSTAAAGAVTIYDEVGSDTTHVIAILKASVAEGNYVYNVQTTRGLKVVTAGATDITVTYTT